MLTLWSLLWADTEDETPPTLDRTFTMLIRMTSRSRIDSEKWADVAGGIADSLEGRAKARILDAADIQNALQAHVAALGMAQPGDSYCSTTVVGGYVSRGYGYAADSDVVSLETRIGEQGKNTEVQWGRRRAQTRSGGRGDRTISRLRKNGQAQGRIVQKY